MSAIGWCRWVAPTVALGLSISGAAAQLKPWPGESAPATSGAAQPAAIQPAPMAAAPPPMMSPAPMMGAPGMGAPGMGAPPGGAREGPCIAEFSQMRADVEKAGKSAKTVSERKGTREEFCKAVTNLHAAQAKWAKYAADNAKHCGIPSEIIGQLRLGQTNLAKMRTNVCNGNGAVAGVAAPPSLSEALGTARLPLTEETPKKRGGTLETLTGEPIR